MRKLTISAIALLALMGIAFAAHSATDRVTAQNEGEKIIMAFETMYGVDGPFVGDTNPIRGIIGDELPWEIANFIVGKLDTTGRLRIVVRGLVFKDDPSVPPELRGKNDEAQFRGCVSCLTEENGQVVTKNVITAGFPANTSGDSLIYAKIALPNPCVAPIIMVLAGSEDKWFAVTGFELEQN